MSHHSDTFHERCRLSIGIWARALLVLGFVALAYLVMNATEAHAQEPTVPYVDTEQMALTVRSGPGTEFAATGRTIPDGTPVQITCQVQGAKVTGKLGTSRLWDRLTDGGYVSDAYVYTGSDDRIAPDCKSTNAPAAPQDDPAAPADTNQEPESHPSPAAADHADNRPAPAAPVPAEAASDGKTYPVRTQGDDLNVRSGAGVQFPVVDHLSNGHRVTIHCTTTVAGTVWDDISGHGSFVSDDYIKTGTNDPVAPPCNAPSPAESHPSPAAADHADNQPAPAAPADTQPAQDQANARQWPAGPYVDTSHDALTERTGPGTDFEPTGRTIPDGTPVQITCQTQGTQVTGKLGTSRLWDKLADGGYVSDAYVYTGTDDRIAPDCGPIESPAADQDKPTTSADTAPAAPDTPAEPVEPAAADPASDRGAEPQPESGPYVDTYRDALTERSGPGTGYAPTGRTIPDGTPVQITCQTEGNTVTGNLVVCLMID